MTPEQPLTCEDCHKTSPLVIETTCPFQQDVHNTIVQAILCPECLQNRIDDI